MNDKPIDSLKGLISLLKEQYEDLHLMDVFMIERQIYEISRCIEV